MHVDVDQPDLIMFGSLCLDIDHILPNAAVYFLLKFGKLSSSFFQQFNFCERRKFVIARHCGRTMTPERPILVSIALPLRSRHHPKSDQVCDHPLTSVELVSFAFHFGGLLFSVLHRTSNGKH